MPEIKFPSEWLKIGVNTEPGDLIQFLDAGTLDTERDQWVFKVAVLRNGDVVEVEKKFGLNKGNFKAIADAYGTNSDNWIQKEMVVEKVIVNNPQTGQRVDSIALSKPKDS